MRRKHETNVRRLDLDLAFRSVGSSAARGGRGLPGRRCGAGGAGGCRGGRRRRRTGGRGRGLRRGEQHHPQRQNRAAQSERQNRLLIHEPIADLRPSPSSGARPGPGRCRRARMGDSVAAASGLTSCRVERHGAAGPPRRTPSRSARTGNMAPRAPGARERARAGRTARGREGSSSWREPNPESTCEQPNLAAQGPIVGACCRRTRDHHEVDGRGHARTAKPPAFADPALQAVAQNRAAHLAAHRDAETSRPRVPEQ